MKPFGHASALRSESHTPFFPVPGSIRLKEKLPAQRPGAKQLTRRQTENDIGLIRCSRT